MGVSEIISGQYGARPTERGSWGVPVGVPFIRPCNVTARATEPISECAVHACASESRSILMSPSAEDRRRNGPGKRIH